MERPLRIGIIGAGDITREKHIPGLKAIKEVEIIGVSNRSLESSKRTSQEFGIPRAYDDWMELIDDPDIDAVVIGTWPYMHCAMSVAALDSGKHVLCQARMAMNAEEAHTMLDASRAHPGLIAQLVPSPSTLKVDRFAKSLIASRYLGEPLAIEVRDCQGFADSESLMHWRQDFDLSGFNTMTLGIWYESIMRWVGEAVRVTGMGRTFVSMRTDSSGHIRAVRIPDHLDVIAEMACGAQAHIQISRVEGHAGPPEVSIYGTKGTLRFFEDKLYGGRRNERMAELTVPSDMQGEWRVEQDFVDSIRDGKPVTLTSFETGVKYMEFTEAVARSCMYGENVSLPL